MPKKYSRRSMTGGDWLSGFGSWGSDTWKKLSGSNSTPSYTGTPSYPSSTGTQSFMPSSTGTSSYPVGGKKHRRKSRKMRGGNFTDNTPTSGLAFHAAPFSGETARPNTWVGGKTKKRRKRVKSCRKR